MSKQTDYCDSYLADLTKILAAVSREEISSCIGVLEDAYRRKARVFIVGNGGSAATAAHLQCDLMLGVARGGNQGFRAYCLADGVPTLTAISNDDGYEHVFAQQLEALAERGDVLIAITGSGNSPNIVAALELAKTMGLTSIGWLGMGGGSAKQLCDVSIVVPSDTYGPIEDLHMVFDHLITSYFVRWTAEQK